MFITTSYFEPSCLMLIDYFIKFTPYASIKNQLCVFRLLYCSVVVLYDLCLVHVIWTVSNVEIGVKYLLLLSFLTAAKFCNLVHIQGMTRVHSHKRYHF